MSEPLPRIEVSAVVRTPMASLLYRRDVTEFLAACHRHDIPADAQITIETKSNDAGAVVYFSLVATKVVERGSL